MSNVGCLADLLVVRLSTLVRTAVPNGERFEMSKQWLRWETAANIAYPLLDKKSILHELEEKMTKADMNDSMNVCAD